MRLSAPPGGKAQTKLTAAQTERANCEITNERINQLKLNKSVEDKNQLSQYHKHKKLHFMRIVNKPGEPIDINRLKVTGK